MSHIEFSPRLREGTVKVDDWKRDKIAANIQNTLNVLCKQWGVEPESILNEDNPLEVNIYGEGAEVDQEGIKLSDPDYYRVMMRNFFDDKHVIETVDSYYPIPFHEVPEEVGQFIGERVDNSWSYENDMASTARDELHGAMGLMEYFPWYVDIELEVLENNLSTILESDSNEHIEYLDHLQEEELPQLKNHLEKLSDNEGFDTTYKHSLQAGIRNEARNILENVPETDQTSLYTHEQLPEDLSEHILEKYLALDELAGYENIDKILNDESPYSIEGIAENIGKVTEFNYSELETLQERINTELNTERDRAYIISRRIAKQIYEGELDFTPTEVIHSTPEIDKALQQSIYVEDREIKLEHGLQHS